MTNEDKITKKKRAVLDKLTSFLPDGIGGNNLLEATSNPEFTQNMLSYFQDSANSDKKNELIENLSSIVEVYCEEMGLDSKMLKDMMKNQA